MHKSAFIVYYLVLLDNGFYKTPGVRAGNVMRVDVAVRRAAAMTSGVKMTLAARTGIPGWGAKKRERRMTPDGGKCVCKYIAEQKLPPSEKKIAGIHGAVRHDAEFRCSCRTANLAKLGI